MQAHALDEGVYIRSMATRGHLGGLAWATPQAVRVLDAAGCEIEEVALASLRAELGTLGHGEALDTLAEQVAAGKLGPYRAADQLLAAVRKAEPPLRSAQIT
jgi:LAO/AO transport system kinase